MTQPIGFPRIVVNTPNAHVEQRPPFTPSDMRAATPNLLQTEKQAVEAIGLEKPSRIADIQRLTKDIDFKSVTRQELMDLGRSLYDLGLISSDTASGLAMGDSRFRDDGTEILGVKFNALEHYSDELEWQKNRLAGARSAEAYTVSNNMTAWVQATVNTLFSLHYFSEHVGTGTGVDIKA